MYFFNPRERSNILIFAGVSAGPAVAGEESLDLPELFCSLGSLIVEGRLPAESEAEAGTRGYTEGPHVELPGKISRHKCSNNQYLVSTDYRVK